MPLTKQSGVVRFKNSCSTPVENRCSRHGYETSGAGLQRERENGINRVEVTLNSA